MFPSPLGVLGLTTFCDDHWRECASGMFPSPLGVLGLTTFTDLFVVVPDDAGFRPLSGFWV